MVTRLGEVERGDEHVDELDADEGGYDAAEAVDDEVALEESGGGHGAVAYAAQG